MQAITINENRDHEFQGEMSIWQCLGEGKGRCAVIIIKISKTNQQTKDHH